MRYFKRPASRAPSPKRRLLLAVAACLAPLTGAAQTQPAAPGDIEAPEAPVPFEAVRPGPPPSPVSNAARPAEDNLPDLTKVAWTIPPVRWGGNTTSNYNWNDNSTGTKSFTQTQTVNLQAASYIYQPWFAQVAGNLGLLGGSSRQSGAIGSDAATRNTAVTYGGNLNLFPVSRFPFQAYLQTADSRASASAVASEYRSKRLGASQSYRPEVGPESYTVSGDRSIVSSANMRSVVDALQGSFGTTVDNHGLAANARYSNSSGDIAGQGSRLLSFTGSHSWHADEDLSVASSASYSHNRINVLRGLELAQNDTQLFQAGSSASWMPDEDLPLTIVAGGNFLRMTTLTENASVMLNNLNGFANASYRFSNNLTANGGMSIVHTAANGVTQAAFSQNGGISYSGNPLTFGEYSYNWGTGASVSNQMISGGPANRSVSTQVQHSLMRNFDFDSSNALTINASESLSVINNSSSGSNAVISHAGGASWRLGIGQRTLAMLSATLSDSMSTGRFASHFRSLTTQGNMQRQLSARSALVGSLNFTVSQQLATAQVQPVTTLTVPDLVPTTPANNNNRNINGSGQIMYSHRSPFDISNLVYSAVAQINASQTNLRLVAGDPNALAWQTGKVLQQNADYRVGRLMFRASASLATLNGKKNASIFFMVTREFGDF